MEKSMFRIFKRRDSKTERKGNSYIKVLTIIVLFSVCLFSLSVYAESSNYVNQATQKLTSNEVQMHTSVSSSLSDQYALHNSFAVYFSNSIIGIALLWFIFQWIVSTKTKSENSSMISCSFRSIFPTVPTIKTFVLRVLFLQQA